MLRIPKESGARDWLILVVGVLAAVRGVVSIHNMGCDIVIMIYISQILRKDLLGIRRVAQQSFTLLVTPGWTSVAVYLLHLFALSEILVEILTHLWLGTCPLLADFAIGLSRFTSRGADACEGA